MRTDRDASGSDDPAARAEAFFATRRDENGDVLKGVFAKAVVQRRRQQSAQPRDAGAGDGIAGTTPGPAGSVNWTPIGPSVVAAGAGPNVGMSGRVNALAVGPAGTRVYAGAANGGVWFSADGGANWRPLDDYAVSPSILSDTEADSLSVGAVAVRFGPSAATDDIYVGTGEPFHNYDRYLGIGVRHSPSGGAPGTWSLEATNLEGLGVYAIVIDPDDPAVVHAATSNGIFRRPAAPPFTTWSQVTSPAFTAPNEEVTSLVVAGTGPTKRYYAVFKYTGTVNRSTNATTWESLTYPFGFGRIALAVAETDPTIVYAFHESGTLARLVGSTFEEVVGLPAQVVFSGVPPQGWYDIAIAVSPVDPNTVFLGGDIYSLFRGTITGSAGSFAFPFDPANLANPALDATFVGQNIHPDLHALAFARNAANTASDGSIVWAGSDGGVFASLNGGDPGSFVPRNIGLAITETAYLAQRPDTDAAVFVGSQDNGTNRLLAEAAGVEVMGGDGGGMAVDQDNPYRVMRQYKYAELDRSETGGGTGAMGGQWSPVPFPPTNAGAGETTEFVAPIASSPEGVSPGLVAFGTNRLWLSDDWGTSWVTLPAGTDPYATPPPNLSQDVIDGLGVRAIAFASATKIFAATYATIWQYDKATTWSRTILPTTGLPQFHMFTALAVDDVAAGTLYATLGSSGGGHLYYWDGTSWSEAMPTSVVDIPAHAVVVDPDHPNEVYVGTDVGVWKGTKTAPATWAWVVYSPGLPESAVVDLALHRKARLLRASTHGRGVWEIELDAATGVDPDLYLRVDYADTGRIVGGARYPWVEGAPDPTKQGFKVHHWMSADLKVRRPSLSGSQVALSSPPDYLDYAVNIGDYVDSTDIETADITGTNRIFVEVHNRGLTPIPAAQVLICLMITDATAALPPLPGGWATHINTGDASSAWLASTSWQFADPLTPYRTPPSDLDVRTPQVVEFETDFASLSLPLGHDHVCAAAFVTASSDPISSVDTSLDYVTMHDKHVAHRNLHLVAAGVTQSTDGRGYDQKPQTFLIELHNPGRKRAKFDFVFDKEAFPGRLTLALPPRVLDQLLRDLEDFELVEHGRGVMSLRKHLGEWMEELGERLEDLGERLEGDNFGVADDRKLPNRRSAFRRTSDRISRLDVRRLLVAREGNRPTLRRVEIAPGAPVTAAVEVETPSSAAPGDSFRLDVIQRADGALLGGSTYVITVFEESKREG